MYKQHSSHRKYRLLILTLFLLTFSMAGGVLWFSLVQAQTAVIITAVSPQNANHNAPLNTSLIITPSEAIQNSSVTTQTIFVHGGFHGQMDGAISFDPITYAPNGNFFPGELVQTTVTADVLASDGSPLTAPYVWQFRTATEISLANFLHRDTFGAGESSSVALGDLDNDGDLDALIANETGQAQEVWLNDGSGDFGTAAHDTFGAGNSKSAALGDLDGDGDLDVFVSNSSSQPREVWLNDGSGDFGAAAHDTFGAGNSTFAALGDLDGDGDLDAIVANFGQAEEVWLNDGSGNFNDVAHDTFGGGQSLSVGLGDLDNDGDLDVIVANSSGQAQEVWLNDGSGSFGAAAHDTFGAGNSSSVALGDLDGDGDLDALIANDFRGAQEVWLNDGGGNFGAVAHDTFGAGDSKSVALGDLDGDGDLDVFIANPLATEVWLNDGSGDFGTAVHDSFNAGNSTSVALGDLNGDGDLDALIANRFSAQETWHNDGPQIDVRGQDVSIFSGDVTPSVSDNTDFGGTAVAGGGIVAHTFAIHNLGDSDLNLTGTPNIALTTNSPFTITAQPGSSLVTQGGLVTFTIAFDPMAIGVFSDTVTIVSDDPGDGSFTFAISGTGLNTAPAANDDAALTYINTPIVVDVLANDSDADGAALTVSSVTQGAHGTVTTDGASVTYLPSPGYAGVDTFTYTASDGDLTSAAIVSIAVHYRIFIPMITWEE